MSEEENALVEALGLKNLHIKLPKFRGVGVYNWKRVILPIVNMLQMYVRGA
ncbi:MAG: hypothetical protein KAR40_14250 [Candidatus Sabulitectum sp.]|nr:hypothetical protein [Candidatus Sabulitectum sp.]